MSEGWQGLVIWTHPLNYRKSEAIVILDVELGIYPSSHSQYQCSVSSTLLRFYLAPSARFDEQQHMTSASYTPSFSFFVKASSADSITIKSDLPAPGPIDAQHDFFVVGDGIKHVKLEQNRYSAVLILVLLWDYFFVSPLHSNVLWISPLVDPNTLEQNGNC